MTNILIIGTEVHAIRYIETYIFRQEVRIDILEINDQCKDIALKYGVKIINKVEDYNNYDIIFLTLETIKRNYYIEMISKQYKGILMLEKPLSLSVCEANKLLYLSKNLNLGVVYNRQFETNINKYKKFLKTKIIIKWPNLSKDKMDPIVNTMANVLDTVFLICGYGEIFELYVQVKNNDYIINFKLNDIEIEICIYNTDDLKQKVLINDDVLEWPNYFTTNNNILDNIITKKLDYEQNIEFAMWNVKGLNKVVDYIKQRRL